MINNQTKLKKITALIVLSFVLFVGVFYFAPVLAQTGDTLGISEIDQNIALGGGDIRTTIAKIIRAVLGLLGIVAVVIVLYGGFTYMTSGGEEEKVARGKKILINGIIGLLIILSSFIIVQFVLGKLSEATGLNKPYNPLCDDPIDAQNNPCPNPEFPTPCEDLHFVVTSITPVNNNTGMNNVVGRVVFSRRLSSNYNESNIGNFISINNVSSTDLTFNIKTGNDYKNSLVEIQYAGDNMCADGASPTPCMPFGDYKIKVDSSIQDLQGNYLETETSCGKFSREGSFNIIGNNPGQTANYSTPTTSFAIFHSSSFLQSSDKFSLDNVGVSVWIKPNLPQKPGNDGDKYTIFQFENYPASRYNLYLADLEDVDSNNEDKIYLVWEYGVEGKSGLIDLGLREDLNGKWSNIVVTHNNNESYKIFVNGEEKLSGSVSENDKVGVDNSTLFLGGSDLVVDDGIENANARFFLGQIHNFYLYNQTLSNELIKNLYSNGRGLYEYNWADSMIHLALNDNSGVNIVNSASELRFNNYNLNWVTEEGKDTGSTTSDVVESGLIVDKTPPSVSPIKFVNRKTGEEKINYLPAGGTYIISSEIVDKINQADGGAGYVHMNWKRLDGGTEFNLFDGPTVEDGSRTSDNDPFDFSYDRLYISPNTKVLDKYLLTLDVYDQDNNHTIVTTTFTIIADHCDNGVQDGDERGVDVGGSCGGGNGENCFDDLDCAFTYQCVDAVGDDKYENKTCQPFPYIEDVDPMDGGSGNWVSILGYNFGPYVKDSVTGTIEFGVDTNNDDKPDTWKPVSIVTCGEGGDTSWNDGWIVVEVPDDIIIPQDSRSAVRLTTARKIQKVGQYITLQDTTIDDWGPNPGPKDRKGWFLKNNILRPGLCRVENESLDYLGAVSGKIKDPVRGIGKGFGSSGKFYFDTVLSGIRGWSDSVVRGFVPNLAEGRVPVYVENVKGQRSNKVPFTIGSDSENQKPVIVSIDPATTTPGSFVTIFGRNFGDAPGRLYWTDSSGGSRCSTENCVRMSLDGMPPFCSETWSSNQIIVKIPQDIDFSVASNSEVIPQTFVKNGIPGKTGENTGYYVINDESGLYSLKEGSVYNINFTLDDIANNLYQENTITKTLNKTRYILNKRPLPPSPIGSYDITILERKSLIPPNQILSRILMVGYTDSPNLDKIVSLNLSTSTNDYTVKISVVSSTIIIESNGQKVTRKVNLAQTLNPEPVVLGSRMASTNLNVNNSWGLFGEIKSISFGDDDLLVENQLENINSVDFLKKFVTVENNLGFYSSGENDFQIYDDVPLPSICFLSPNFGPAPREEIKLKGINFSLDPTVYFFTDKSELTRVNSNITGWLQTPFSNIFLRGLANESGGQVISTPIPYDLDFGYSMKVGLSPIKVKDQNNKFSNSIYYNVQDCRVASSTIPGYQCCGDESPEAGKWKPENIGCFGSSKDAGYVWRFTTGLLPDNPYVVVSCDQDNYDSTGEFPSPVPSVDWRSGQNACINSIIAVRFGPNGVTMNEESINTATVKVYKCGTTDQFGIENCNSTSINLSNECDSEIGCLVFENNILNIYIPPLDFTTGTWFHVELMEDIKSQKEYEEFGQIIVETKNLLKSRPMKEAVENEYDGKVAFNFNFKTGEKKCVLTGAGMIPVEHTTNRLGIVQDPKYKFVFSSQDIFGPIFPQGPIHPLYYYLWGKGDQECSVMNVDGLGWNWGVRNSVDSRLNEKWAEADNAPTRDGELNIRRKYTDSRGMVTAWANTAPYNVWILANINISEDRSILSSADIRKGTPGATGNNDGYYLVNDSEGKFSLKNGSNYKINFTLDEVSNDKYNVSSNPLDKQIYKSRVLLNKGMVLWTNKEAEAWYEENGEEAIFNYSPGSYYLVVSEIKNRNFSSSGELVDATLVSRTLQFWYATSLDSATKVVDLVLSTSTDDYSINLSVENNVISINDGTSSDTFLLNNLIQSNDKPLLIGTGSTSTEGNNNYGLYGKFSKLEFLDSGSENFRTITATSSLTVDLLDPKVVEYWPNCIEACINTDFGVRFNMPMMKNTYNGNVELYKCDTEQECIDKDLNKLEKKDIQTPFENSDEETLNFYPEENLISDTWYLVRLKDGIKAIGGFEDGDTAKPVAGKSLKEFTWKFKTRNNPSPCLAESVDVLPDPLRVYSVGQKDKIQAQPKGAPDSCNPNGQRLNPWFFTWNWLSENPLVFSITKFSTSNSLNPYCNKNCLYKGSDISRSTEPVYVCGNGIVEPGEDCDISGVNEDGIEEVANVSCNYICLRPGNNNFVLATTTIDAGKCGDGHVNYTVGEECDPGISEQKSYCNNNCLKNGSSKVANLEKSVSYCGSGSITLDEDCDIAKDTKDNLGKIGCSENCLHTGTQLSQIWCDEQNKIDGICGGALATSVCGNGVIETGEECELGSEGMVKFLNGNSVGSFVTSSLEKAQNHCNSRCLIQNICGIIEIPLNDETNRGGLRCVKGSEGCNNDCTLAGSSILYSNSTICGDGQIETGEFGICEVTSGSLLAQYGTSTSGMLGQSPVQVTTAIGEEASVGVIPGLNGVKGQMSTSSAQTIGYFDKGSITNLETADVRTGLGDYHLVCGYEEFVKPDEEGQYNLCPNNRVSNKKGVATNSCCYNRPMRVDEYPVDADGFGGRGVCRNTYIETVIKGFINPNKVSSNNFGLVIGYGEDHICSSTPGSVDITEQVNKILGSEDTRQLTFLGKIWHGIKTFFARLFGLETKAIDSSYALVDDIEVWCTVPTPLSFHVSNDLDFVESEDGRPENRVLRSVTTTISAYLGDILGENQVYGVFLRGGKDGIQDVKGVGIKNANEEKTNINDIWFFKTGNQICKINNISVTPESYLFDAPNTSADFEARAISLNEDKSENRIVSTPAYEWEWSWGPTEHKVFDIPSATNPYNTISARNVEGETTALVKALVTRDVDTTSGNHRGKFFTASSDLTAMFCANPWPAKNEDGSWKPYKDEKYNFSFSYCADDGVSGDLNDDLPFFVMRDVTKQVAYGVTPEVSGVCASDSQTECLEDSDCPYVTGYWNPPYMNGVESGTYTSLCVQPSSITQLNNNNCNKFYSDTGKYCQKVPGEGESLQYPPQYNSTYRSCNSNTDCAVSDNEECRGINYNWLVSNDCVGSKLSEEYTEMVNASTIFAGTLQRLISFDKNDRSDDVFGLQIFYNDDHLSAMDWYKDKFPNSSPQSIEIAGYDGVKDGNNYYISAKNIVEEESAYAKNDYRIYYNIYNFSINQGASEDTQKVLSQVLESLVFNLNISDYGYCLDASVLDNTRLSMDPDTQKAINSNNLTCLNDFDCRDTNGVPLESTNGVCSNAKTKFFRDLDRLQRIKNTQLALDNYFVKKNDYNFTGALKGGTYIPGYTVSTWASWNETLGKYANTSLPQDNINAWTACTDSEAESQTCWNADKLTYSCPAYSSVFEYEYVSSTNSYMLHAPLEYLTNYSHFVVGSEVGDMSINTSTFTTDPYCKGESFSLKSGICGDGVIQPGSGEECEPVGSSKVSQSGYLPAQIGKCDYSSVDKECGVNNDCPKIKISLIENSNLVNYYVLDNLDSGLCHYNNSLLFGEIREGNELEVFSCSNNSDCSNKNTYTNLDSKIISVLSSTTTFVVQDDRLLSPPGGIFECLPISETNYDELNFGTCVGGRLAGTEPENCPAGSTANYICSPTCTWTPGTCLSKIKCGNGMVEVGEACDDGALNGKYGQCNSSCGGLSEQYCGNGKQDFSGSSPLEFCENVGNKSYATYTGSVRYCLADHGVRCATNSDCLPVNFNTEEEENLFVTGIFNNPSRFYDFKNNQTSSGRCIKGVDFSKMCSNNSSKSCDSNSDCIIIKDVWSDSDSTFSVSDIKFDPVFGYDSSLYANGFTLTDIKANPCVSSPSKTTLLENSNSGLLKCNSGSAFCRYLGSNNNFNKIYTGYCLDNKTVLCNTDENCNVPSDFNNYILTRTDADGENWLDKFTTSTDDVGPCITTVGKVGSLYNFNKENSCSWDCQKYGQYCGDGVKNGDEECDDGNTINGDSCNNNCQKIVDYVAPVCGNKVVEGSEVCDLGKFCTDLKTSCTSDSECKNKDGTLIVDGVCKLREALDSNRTYYCSADCKTKTDYISSCGNGVIDNEEFCDGGTKNGKTCVPGYGESCTYCSQDCKKIFTIDSPNYCGNGKIDKIKDGEYEVCDRLANGVVIENDKINNNKPIGTTKSCPDKGNYTCTDCSQPPGNTCYKCEDGYSVPKLSLINVTGQAKDPVNFLDYNLFFIRWNPTQAKIIKTVDIRGFNDNFILDDDGIRLNDDCKNEYRFGFGSDLFNIDVTTDDEGNKVENFGLMEKESLSAPIKINTSTADVFEFPRAGMSDPFYQNFIFSPAVPEGVYRLVVVWDGNINDFEPNINIYNQGFRDITESGTSVINNFDGSGCASNFPLSSSCQDLGGVYFHPTLSKGGLKIKAVTINTNNLNGFVYKIFLSNFFPKTIGKFKNDNIKVYLYKNHSGQDDYSIYNSDRIFDISKTDGSNEDSVYWNILNLSNLVGVLDPVPGFDGKTWTSFSEISNSDNFVLDQNTIDKLEKNKTYVYLNVLGYDYSKSDSGVKNVTNGKAIEQFDISYFFNNSELRKDFSGSFLPGLIINNTISDWNTAFANYPNIHPIMYEIVNKFNNIPMGKIGNDNIFYSNDVLITELVDLLGIFKVDETVNKEYLYSVRLLPFANNTESSLNRDFFAKEIYRGTAILPLILHKDGAGNLTIERVPLTYLNKDILESEKMKNSDENKYWAYNLFSFTFNNNEDSIIIKPVNQFSSYDEMYNLFFPL